MTRETTTTIVRPLAKGQITIPVAMRRALGITENTPLEVQIDGERIVISKLVLASEYEARIYSDEEIAQFLEEDKISPELAAWARRRFGRRPA